MKLKGKLISTYLIIALFIVIVAGVSLLSLYQVNKNSKEMYHNRVVPLTIIVELANLTEIVCAPGARGILVNLLLQTA